MYGYGLLILTSRVIFRLLNPKPLSIFVHATSKLFEMPPKLYLIRHGQGEHNINVCTMYLLSYFKAKADLSCRMPIIFVTPC